LIKENPRDINRIAREECNNLQQIRFVEILQKYFFKPPDFKIPPKLFWIYESTGIEKKRLVTESFGTVCIVSGLKTLVFQQCSTS
jgi:hypothetical protein